MSPIFPFKQLWKQFGLLTYVSTQSDSQKKWTVSALMSALINNHICQKTHSFERTPRLFRFQASAQKTSQTISVQTVDKNQTVKLKDMLCWTLGFTLWFNTIIYHWIYPCWMWGQQCTALRPVWLNTAQWRSICLAAGRPTESPAWDYLHRETLPGNPQD